MTLKELRGRCRIAAGDHNTDVHTPDLNGDVRAAVRKAVRYAGGMERTSEITTVSGTREYGTDAGFPSDFMKIQGIHDDTQDVWLDQRGFRDKLFSSTGDSLEFYIRAKQVILTKEPDSVNVLTMYYVGSGDDVTGDEDTILSEFSIPDDDPLWKAVTHEYAARYWDNRLAEAEGKMQTVLIKVAERALARHTVAALENRQLFRKEVNEMNRNKATQTALPRAYFIQSDEMDHGIHLRRR